MLLIIWTCVCVYTEMCLLESVQISLALFVKDLDSREELVLNPGRATSGLNQINP